MDKDLEKALEFANFSATLSTQKRLLQQKYQEDLVLYHLSGRFTVSKEFFSFVSNLVMLDVKKTVITDDNNTPILVEDLAQFVSLVKQQYITASNRYYSEYKALTTKRNVEGLVNE
jgi:hypothetical protein